ncbi:hypothetical protein [Streptomyces noursei]|uniref:hypothetical protein n=1 Tax=Streptomyces noursei TaxID=1971 RepID=UPI00381E3554
MKLTVNQVDERETKGLPAFANGLHIALDAVTAGLTLPLGSGVIEGNVTRVKLLKCQHYGRAGFDLPRRAPSRPADSTFTPKGPARSGPLSHARTHPPGACSAAPRVHCQGHLDTPAAAPSTGQAPTGTAPAPTPARRRSPAAQGEEATATAVRLASERAAARSEAGQQHVTAEQKTADSARTQLAQQIGHTLGLVEDVSPPAPAA